MYSIYFPHAQHFIAMEGPDSTDFLHRLTTTHLKSLQTNEGSEGCFLTPQGKIRSYFQLWKYGPSEYAFEIDGGQQDQWKNNLLTVIDQYTFSEKFTLNDLSTHLQCVWIFADEGSLNHPTFSQWPAPQKTLTLENQVRLCCHRTIQPQEGSKKVWYSAWAQEKTLKDWIQNQLPEATTLTENELENWRIQSILPRVDHEIKESVTPLEIGLKTAIAPNKGCYPGQEVVEKIISLGSPAKRLALIEFQLKDLPDSSLSLPELKTDLSAHLKDKALCNLASPPLEVGELTSFSLQENSILALALMKKTHTKLGSEVSLRLGSHTLKGSLLQLAPYE